MSAVFNFASYLTLKKSKKTAVMMIYLVSALVVLAAIVGGYTLYLHGDAADMEAADESVVDDSVDEAEIDLKDVKGIGPAREKKLRESFGDALAVLSADEQELAEVVTSRTAKKISDSEPEDFV